MGEEVGTMQFYSSRGANKKNLMRKRKKWERERKKKKKEKNIYMRKREKYELCASRTKLWQGVRCNVVVADDVMELETIEFVL
jgi:hypothetical protein